MAYTEEQKRDFVRQVQQQLRTLSSIYNEIPEVLPTGVFDAQTAEAVRQFQRISNLPVTGKIDFDTWNAIFAGSCVIDESACQPLLIEPFPSPLYIIRPGDSGGIVYILQAMLNALTAYYSNLIPIPYTGVYDDATREQVTRFQNIANTKVTGMVNKDTWNALARIYNTIVHRPPLLWRLQNDMPRKTL